MKRYVSLEEISDGKLYGGNDMVKADCQGCKGCSDCCKGMGNSIILDPYDAFRLTDGLGVEFAALLEKAVALNVVDGVILPNLMMTGADEQCLFLNEEGRCTIHGIRPGICRLFPLGRVYEDGGFKYFLQTGECTKTHTKVKVNKWVDTPNFKRYEQFVCDWHYFLNWVEERLTEADEETTKIWNMNLLQIFYLTPYDGEKDFYEQFEERRELYLRRFS